MFGEALLPTTVIPTPSEVIEWIDEAEVPNISWREERESVYNSQRGMDEESITFFPVDFFSEFFFFFCGVTVTVP